VPIVREDAPLPLRHAEDWLALIAGLGLKGPTLQLASHSAFCAYGDGILSLCLPDSMEHLRTENLVRQLTQALSTRLGTAPKIRFDKATEVGDTLHARGERQRDRRQSAAEAAFLADPVVSRLIGEGGQVVPDSVRPRD
jgi:DNA polymerase-3 subunit gamma/tau